MQGKGSGGVHSRSLSPPRNTTEEPLHPRVPSAAWSPFRLVLLIGSGRVFHLSTKQVESSKNRDSKNLELMALSLTVRAGVRARASRPFQCAPEPKAWS